MKNIKKYESFNSDEFSGEWSLSRWQEHFKRVKEDPDYKSRWKEHQSNKVKEYWITLSPFQKESDVPDLPNPISDFYIQRLIELGAIPKSKLEDGQWYYGNYRNSQFGKWNESKQVFEHLRYKFGYRWDDCNHFQDDNGFALFVPLRKATSEEIEEIQTQINSIS